MKMTQNETSAILSIPFELHIFHCAFLLIVFLSLHNRLVSIENDTKARIFKLVDLWELFFRFRVGGRKKRLNKSLKMTS